MKSYSKQQLADFAGVCRSTFYKWLKTDREYLKSMGVSRYAKVLPPVVVHYLCEKYQIELPES